ncbi:MAG: hypothetical protein RMI49_00955 [Candidatus Caldarchaeum sp.]|nr:hypothetical protein [Candidatus Caldarchaeum sp.]
MKAYLSGALPRTERLIKAYRDFAKNKISQRDLLDEVGKVSRQYIEIQEKNRLTYIIDGMITWDDPLRPFASSLRNVEIDGISRWFDNNFFYKKPVITGEISLKNDIDESIFFHNLIDQRKRKIVLPEPYSFARLSENRFYKRFDDLVLDVADALAKFVNRLGSFAQIQLTSPSLVYTKATEDDFEKSKTAVETVKRKTRGEIFLHLPFGSAENKLQYLLEFDVEILGIDMYRTPVEVLSKLDTDKSLYLGLINGRNTVLENPGDILKMIDRVKKIAAVKEIHVGPSCELDYLPSDYALRKIELIGEILKSVGSNG